MSHNILITGGSGYLGGTLLAHLATLDPLSHGTIFALVRTAEQAWAVKTRYSVKPLNFDPYNESAIHDNIVDNEISVVFHLIHAGRAESQTLFIKSLAEVGKRTGKEVHLLHTSGAKIFSSHAGAPTNRELRDDDPELYQIQQGQKAPTALIQGAINANNEVMKQAEIYGVRSYIFVPSIVLAIVKAAKAASRVYRTDDNHPFWPVCHVLDNTSFYLAILRSILAEDSNLGTGSNGYYLGASGSIAWDDIYNAMAQALFKRGIIDNEEVQMADPTALEKMGQGLGCPPGFVAVQLGGNCTFTAKHGKQIGWNPRYGPDHILGAIDNEVELILQNLKE